MGRLFKRWRLRRRWQALVFGLAGVAIAGALLSRAWVGDGSQLSKPTLRVVGAVVDVGERSVTVNLGERDGIEKGTLLQVSRSKVAETDASTGKPTVVRTEPIGELKALDVDEEACEAVPASEGAPMPAIQVGDKVAVKG